MICTIQSVSFKHGWFYQYKVHTEKSENLTKQEFSSLNSYLLDMFTSCPHGYFNSGPRGSRLKFKVPNLNCSCLTGHEVSSLARLGLEQNAARYKQDHPKVQVFMLENDNQTIAMEVPIWMMPDELDCFRPLLKSDEPLTGHIDVLRIQDGKVWIWDYKPNAHLEKYASTQTYFYALMLSGRTGIPLEKFRCGYFDKYYAYVFKPELDLLKLQEGLCGYE